MAGVKLSKLEGQISSIEEAMAGEATRRLNFDGTAPDPAKLALAIPVYNYDAEAVQILQFSQKTLITQLDQISQMDDYKDDLLEWDFVLAREGVEKKHYLLSTHCP